MCFLGRPCVFWEDLVFSGKTLCFLGRPCVFWEDLEFSGKALFLRRASPRVSVIAIHVAALTSRCVLKIFLNIFLIITGNTSNLQLMNWSPLLIHSRQLRFQLSYLAGLASREVPHQWMCLFHALAAHHFVLDLLCQLWSADCVQPSRVLRQRSEQLVPALPASATSPWWWALVTRGQMERRETDQQFWSNAMGHLASHLIIATKIATGDGQRWRDGRTERQR